MSSKHGSVTRRGFLESAGAALGAAALGPACDGESKPGNGEGDSGTSSGVPVSVVARTNLDEAVALAVELAGGLNAIQPGQTVFIKPNAVSDRALGTAGIRTNPEVLAAVVRLVKRRNPGRIIVGDRSARSFPDTDRVLRATGLRDAALAAGADEVYAARSPVEAPDEWLLLKPPHYEETWGAAGGLLAMRRIVEADHLINVPACKDHRYALFSMCMKNFVGAIGDATRGPLHFGSSISGNFGPIGRDIAVMNQMFSPLLNVLDATTALINGGPEGDAGDAVRTSPGLVCASPNRGALDALGVALLQLELSRTAVPVPDFAHAKLKELSPWRTPQIQNAAELGFGVSGPSAVTLLFDGVSDAAELQRLFEG
jgi:uncharacterized protein (DUF362 family)